MHTAKRAMLAINVIGGISVLGSYAHGLASNPETSGAVWGGVPEDLRPLYTVNMLLAATGYFLFSYFLFFRLDPERTTIAERFGFGAFNWIYAAILFPSAIWMPLTFAMIDAPSTGLWAATRITLAIVGLGSVGLVAALVAVRPRVTSWAHRLAILGALPFAVQTALLDAIVWPAYFPAP